MQNDNRHLDGFDSGCCVAPIAKCPFSSVSALAPALRSKQQNQGLEHTTSKTNQIAQWPNECCVEAHWICCVYRYTHYLRCVLVDALMPLLCTTFWERERVA